MTKEEKAAEARGQKFKEEQKAKLVNGNIFDHMTKMRDMEEARFRYFHYVSDLWKAIQKHITYAKDCVLIDRKDAVMIHRAAYGVTLERTNLFSDKNYFAMTIKVEFVPQEEMHRECPNTYVETFYLQPPIDLELNFTEGKFNAWLKELKRKRDTENLKEEKAELKRLMAKINSRKRK